MIEVNYPMLLSPMTLVPKALPDAKVQSMFYQSVNQMPARVGPRIQQRERAKQVVPLTKRDYVPKSALLAAPVVFQERKMLSPSGCEVTYSSQWEKEQQRKTAEERCAAPYACEHLAKKAQQDSVISCPGSANPTGHFGLESTEFLGKIGFTDFLYSISDNEFLNRPKNASDRKSVTDAQVGSSNLVRTSDFIDSLTSSVSVILLFFTPQYGLTSICSIQASFHEPESARVEYELLHYEIVEGSKLLLYIGVQIAVVINLFATTIDAFYQFRTLYIERKLGIEMNLKDVFGSMVDVFVSSAIFVYVCMRIDDKASSAAVSTSILSDLDNIDWSSLEMQLFTKKELFLNRVEQVYARAEKERSLDNLCHVILLVNLIRVINATSMHPRLVCCLLKSLFLSLPPSLPSFLPPSLPLLHTDRHSNLVSFFVFYGMGMWNLPAAIFTSVTYVCANLSEPAFGDLESGVQRPSACHDPHFASHGVLRRHRPLAFRQYPCRFFFFLTCSSPISHSILFAMPDCLRDVT